MRNPQAMIEEVERVLARNSHIILRVFAAYLHRTLTPIEISLYLDHVQEQIVRANLDGQNPRVFKARYKAGQRALELHNASMLKQLKKALEVGPQAFVQTADGDWEKQ